MNTESAPKAPSEETSEALSKRIRNELLELGVEECPEEIIERLLIIEKRSKFNNDSRMICEGFRNVLGAIESSSDSRHLTSKQIQEGELAAFLHDIGKSGSSEADFSGQTAVIKLFSAEFSFPVDPHKTVSEATKERFPHEYDEMIRNLGQSGVNEEMTLRQFYDRHAQWTHDILEKFPKISSKRVRIIAASHHIDRHINPYNIALDEVPMESLMVGALENYIDLLEEKVLMAVDKYQAAISRRGSVGEVAHEKAIDFLRKIFEEGYANDQVMNLIIKTIDELGKKNALFPKTTGPYLSLRKAA